MKVIEQMLARYPARDRHHAMREVMQEIALAGLQRGGFFDKAAFYGGTCLRIFHDLPRFSEDLDFSLLEADEKFALQPYFAALRAEFSAFGFEVEIVARNKAVKSAVVSAFLKQGTSIYEVRVASQRVLKIKFEVDTDPPGGFATEERLLLQPYSFYVKCYALPDLFAGKLHAVLFRRWKNRVKVRDHDGLIAVLSQRQGRVHSAVIKLDALPDPVRATTEHHDLVAPGRVGFAFVFVGRVQVGGMGGELGGA